jgi:predicted amidohydrolase YtcJ
LQARAFDELAAEYDAPFTESANGRTTRALAHGRVVDLRGDRLLPGLVNSHDHLQLNTLPALETDRIAEVDARRRRDSAFEAQVAISRDDRLLVGGLKTS